MSIEDTRHKAAWPTLRSLARYLLPLLFFLTVAFLVSVYLDLKDIIDVYPKSRSVHMCAVCGREVVVRRQFGLEWQSDDYPRAPGYCARFVGQHQHILLEDTGHGSIMFMPRAYHDVPMAGHYVLRALPTLEGTPYLEPVVKALCDVDNYYAYVARDVLFFESLGLLHPDYPLTRAKLYAWWAKNRHLFQIEHDPQKALPLLKEIAAQVHPGGYGARQTLTYHKRDGVPTKGAWLKRSAR